MSTDETALRERLAAALCAVENPNAVTWNQAAQPFKDIYLRRADALMPVVAQEVAAAVDRGWGQGYNHYAAAVLPAERERTLGDARAEGAAEVRAKVEAVLNSWQMSESRYHPVRAIDADLRAALDEREGR